MTFPNYPDDEPIRFVGELATRTRNALARNGVLTVGALRLMIDAGEDPRDFRGIGETGMADIHALVGA